MGMADQGGQTVRIAGADAQLFLVEPIQIGSRLARCKLSLDRVALRNGDCKERPRRRIDEPETRAAMLDERNIDGEVAALLDEFLGAVEGSTRKKRSPRGPCAPP